MEIDNFKLVPCVHVSSHACICINCRCNESLNYIENNDFILDQIKLLDWFNFNINIP
jgi:hypothetical protein